MGVIYLHGVAYGKGNGGGGGTTDNYNELSNKPQINSTTLVGNKTTSDLNLADGTSIYVDANDKLAIAEVEIPEADIDALFP